MANHEGDPFVPAPDYLPDVIDYFAQPDHRTELDNFMGFYNTYCHPPGGISEQIADHPIDVAIGISWPSRQVIALRQNEPELGEKIDFQLSVYDILSGETTDYLVNQEPLLDQSKGFGDIPRLTFHAQLPQTVSLALSTQSVDWTSPATNNNPVPLPDILLLPHQIAYQNNI